MDGNAEIIRMLDKILMKLNEIEVNTSSIDSSATYSDNSLDEIKAGVAAILDNTSK